MSSDMSYQPLRGAPVSASARPHESRSLAQQELARLSESAARQRQVCKQAEAIYRQVQQEYEETRARVAEEEASAQRAALEQQVRADESRCALLGEGELEELDPLGARVRVSQLQLFNLRVPASDYWGFTGSEECKPLTSAVFGKITGYPHMSTLGAGCCDSSYHMRATCPNEIRWIYTAKDAQHVGNYVLVLQQGWFLNTSGGNRVGHWSKRYSYVSLTKEQLQDLLAEAHASRCVIL